MSNNDNKTDDKNRNVPALRFEGFTDPWVQCKLSELVFFRKGNSYSKNDLSNAGKKIFLYGQLYTNYELVIKSGIKYTDKLINNPVLSTGDEILMPSSGEDPLEISIASVLNEPDVIIGGDINILKPKNEKTHSLFLALLLSNGSNKLRLASLSEGVSIIHLYNNSLKNLNIRIPSKSEQEKISKVIMKLDSIITLEQEKHKRLIGLFNQLYTNIFSESLRYLSKKYSIVKLSDITFQHDERAEDNRYPLLSSTLRGIFLQSEYFDNNTASSDIYNYKVVPNGYFTYRSMSDTGKFKINLQNIVEKGIVSPAYPVFKLSDNINKVYFEKYIEYCPEAQYKISVAAQGGTRLALPFTKLQDIEIFLHTPEDQKNISDLISLIDKIILLSENKILKLQLLKQFLLSNLFI